MYGRLCKDEQGEIKVLKAALDELDISSEPNLFGARIGRRQALDFARAVD